MARTASRRLKVYAAQIGFFDTVVAAANQGEALAAWGVRQNLFAEGRAKVTTEAAAVEAATAHPNTPLRRAVGSKAAFSLEPDLPEITDAPKRPKLKAVPEAKVKPPPRARPDRTVLSGAEKALAAINQRRIDEEADIERQRSELDDEDEASRKRWRKERAEAEKVLAQARAAFVAAGGEA